MASRRAAFSPSRSGSINGVYNDARRRSTTYFIADGKSFAARIHANRPAGRGNEQVFSRGMGHTAYLPKQVKLLTDGAIYSQLMMMKDGYATATTAHGSWTRPLRLRLPLTTCNRYSKVGFP